MHHTKSCLLTIFLSAVYSFDLWEVTECAGRPLRAAVLTAPRSPAQPQEGSWRIGWDWYLRWEKLT